MSSASRRTTGRQGRGTLARYTDPAGTEHRVVLRGRLVLDLCEGDLPRLVARLSDEEGVRQARALLEGGAVDEGYLARMRREPRPICRALSPDDLRPTADGAGEERGGLADGAVRGPLAA